MLVIVILVLIFTCFAGVIVFGAPYLPTLKPQINSIFELADIKKGQSLVELGCGDGRILVAAAKRGIKVTGYELNPILALICYFRTRKYNGLVKIVWGDFWRQKWPDSDYIFTFLLPKYMSRLDKTIEQKSVKPIRLISFAFSVPDKKANLHKYGLYLYDYL